MWLGVCAQWWEVPRDALMNRTKNRPLPRGAVSPRHALAFAAVTGGLGVAALAWQARGAWGCFICCSPRPSFECTPWLD